MKSVRKTGRKINAVVEETLDDEDEEESCPGGCDDLDNATAETSSPQEVDLRCKCAVENSWRFSLRVMEAMRWLQRDPDQLSTSTAEEIVEHIRANYRSDGDLYAQVRTALRQVCSQGFVVQLLENEYHLIGPVAKSTQPSHCSLDCEGRAPSRRRAPRGTTFNHLEDLPTKDIRHSTREVMNNDRDDYRNERVDTSEESPLACDCKDISTMRKERLPQREDTARVQKARPASPIAGPSRAFQRTTPSAPARLKDNEETTTEDEEDLDCTCDTVRNAQEKTRERTRDRPPHVVSGNHRNKRRRRNDVNQDTETTDEEDENNDSVYRRLRPRRRGRSATRERELKRWIRRCREECERRGAQRRQ